MSTRETMTEIHNYVRLAKEAGWCCQCCHPWYDLLCNCGNNNDFRDRVCEFIKELAATLPDGAERELDSELDNIEDQAELQLRKYLRADKPKLEVVEDQAYFDGDKPKENLTIGVIAAAKIKENIHTYVRAARAAKLCDGCCLPWRNIECECPEDDDAPQAEGCGYDEYRLVEKLAAILPPHVLHELDGEIDALAILDACPRSHLEETKAEIKQHYVAALMGNHCNQCCLPWNNGTCSCGFAQSREHYRECNRIAILAQQLPPSSLHDLNRDLHAIEEVLSMTKPQPQKYTPMKLDPKLCVVPEPLDYDVLLGIALERCRQNEKWGGKEHDDLHFHKDWGEFIHLRTREIGYSPTSKTTRKLLVQIAALALAGIESIDRKLGDK